MRIIIDMQACQSSGSRNRGIGRYGMSLAQAIVRNCGTHEIILVLNGAFTDSIHSIRESFKNILPAVNIHIWYPAGQVSHMDNSNNWHRKASELLREAFFKSLKPDIILVMSLFEGFDDNSVTSIKLLNKKIPTAVILYDLIPLIHKNIYLENPNINIWYEEKIKFLKEADLLLSISESSRQEGIEYLNFETSKIKNISTAADSQFKPLSISKNIEENVRKRYALNKPFIMYTGGIDHRKNIEGLINAYAMLPLALREKYKLAIVCSINSVEKDRLLEFAIKKGLNSNEVVFTGFVPEEDLLMLYNLCKVFVFPSWHEGFGLPALEAMSCGRAVIASNCTSLPEVIGCEDALFDPYDPLSISNKLQEVLENNSFRVLLEEHALKQAKYFSWEESAKKAILAMEVCLKEIVPQQIENDENFLLKTRPRLAYVSPLPPERSGISYYSAELIPELSAFYDIEVIVNQEQVSSSWFKGKLKSRTVDWFLKNFSSYDRVLYHFGNSEYHRHMFELLEIIPGIVVLHDFFLSGIIAYMQNLGIKPNYWIESLYLSHGYSAIKDFYEADDKSEVIMKYPCNFNILQNAQDIIVHSDFSKKLVKQWYGIDVTKDWTYIPHLRAPVITTYETRLSSRFKLGLKEEQFIVCSFGLLGKTKLNHKLINAWLSSPLAYDDRCILVFVGENAANEYGKELENIIKKSACKNRIQITGWADTELFQTYLHAADVGVQLRTLSRGETSGTVLDCMNYGLATIVNANGSMADLEPETVWMLKDDFSEEELSEALTTLYKDRNLCSKLGKKAKEKILQDHAPKKCAIDYVNAIEKSYNFNFLELLRKISILDLKGKSSEKKLINMAQAIDYSFKPKLQHKKLFLDITLLLADDKKSFQLQTVNSILQDLLINPPEGYRVEPIYYDKGIKTLCYAREFSLNFLNIHAPLHDETINYSFGDVVISFDSSLKPQSEQNDIYSLMQGEGVKMYSFFERQFLEIVELINFYKMQEKEEWLNQLGS